MYMQLNGNPVIVRTTRKPRKKTKKNSACMPGFDICISSFLLSALTCARKSLVCHTTRCVATIVLLDLKATNQICDSYWNISKLCRLFTKLY